jgi:hypothetical protein
MPEPVCFACGQSTGQRPRLNRLTDGRVCPACRDRLMDSLPPLLPSHLAEVSLEGWEDEEEDSEDYSPGA